MGEEVKDLADTVLNAHLLGVNGQIGVGGHVIGVRDAGELWDPAGASSGIEPLEIPSLALLKRGADVNEDEVPDRLDKRSFARI